MSHCQFIGLWRSTHFTCLGKSYTMRLLPFHFSAKRSKLETWNVQIFSALTGTSQQLSPGLPIFKDTWPQGELCDRKTSPPCTRLLSHCEHSPCFASAICGDFVTNESCEIINVMLFSFCPTVRWLTLRRWRGLGEALFWTHTRKQLPRNHVTHKNSQPLNPKYMNEWLK